MKVLPLSFYITNKKFLVREYWYFKSKEIEEEEKVNIREPWNKRACTKLVFILTYKCKGHADHSDYSHPPLFVYVENRKVIKING